MCENLGLGWRIGILPIFADCSDPEARVQTTAYERKCEGPVVAERRLMSAKGFHNSLAVGRPAFEGKTLEFSTLDFVYEVPAPPVQLEHAVVWIV